MAPPPYFHMGLAAYLETSNAEAPRRPGAVGAGPLSGETG